MQQFRRTFAGKRKKGARLFFISLCVCENLFARETLPRRCLVSWVANHPGKITDKKNDLVPKCLQCLEFQKRHDVAKVERWSGRVNTEINTHTLSSRKLVP